MKERTDSTSQSEYRIDPELRQRLILRIVMAGIAIAALLGGLAAIDRYYAPPPPPPPALTAALKSLTDKTAEIPSAAAPERTASPSIAPVAEAQVPVMTTLGGTIKTTESPTLAPTKEMITESHHSVAKPSVDQPSPPNVLAGDQNMPNKFVLQMGIFNDVANALHLNEKLKQGGIPSRIEARVQVGPFKTRAEAESVRAKLIGLGITAGPLIPVRK